MDEKQIISTYGFAENDQMKNRHRFVSNIIYKRPIRKGTQFQSINLNEEPNITPTGGLNIIHAPEAFMSVDRITLVKGKFSKQRRIIYHLDSRPGQIGCTLLLQMLKINDGAEFSKHKFVQKIDEEFFHGQGVNISTGEINEAISRMFRKTMVNFFEIDGRKFQRKNFLIKIHELNLSNKSQTTYSFFKRDIDEQTKQFTIQLNKLL